LGDISVFASEGPKTPQQQVTGFGVVEVAPVGGASAKTGMRMDGWMDGSCRKE